MSIASAIIDPVLNLHGTAAYSLVGALAFAEAAVFVGFVLPGETAVIIGGVLASQHAVSLPVMIGVVVLAAIGGDSVGYEVGQRYGRRLLGLRIVRRHQRRIETASMRLQTSGGPAVLLSRFTAFLRAVVPGLAGLAHMPYRKFLAWNAVGGVVWGAGFTLVGYMAGTGYEAIETYAGDLSYVVLAGVTVLALVLTVRHWRRDQDLPPGAGRAPVVDTAAE